MQVVIHTATGTIKGFIDGTHWIAMQKNNHQADSVLLRRLQDDVLEQVTLADTKAVFFVHKFEGETGHSAILFHEAYDPPECLWVRVRFQDGEVIEGMVDNRQSYVLDPGFLITPTDPTGNNWLIYIFKDRVKEFEVLGLRQRPSTWPIEAAPE